MSSIENMAGRKRVSSVVKIKELPAGSIRFDALMITLIYWFVLGFYLDGGAHLRGQVDNTFFTPWHAMLYSGGLAVGLVLGVTQIRNMRKGHTLLRALPPGYLPALVGIGIFSVSGVFDFGWHSLFGFEVGMEALLSPSHLLLATGAFLFISAPLRAAWGRSGDSTWRTLLPAMLSMAATLSQLTFFTQYANFASRPQTLIDLPPTVDNFFFSVYGVMSMLIPSALSISVVLLLLRRWTLPLGTVTLIWTLNTVLMIWLRLPFVTGLLPTFVVVPLGGVLADFLLWRFRPSSNRPVALRIFAFSVPFVTSLLYLLVLNTFGTGLWWQIHMWLGAPFLAGIAGLFLSLLAVPPTIPSELSTQSH
jgi:hypothetical protein